MISHKHKFIFVHINKTGGKSIKALLERYSQGSMAHQSIIQLNKQAYSDDYFKFIFIAVQVSDKNKSNKSSQ